MRLLRMALMLIPGLAWGYVSGIDDFNVNLPPETQKQVDDTILTYYQHPTPEKVDKLLTLMNTTPLLQKKTSWPPVIGFLTVIFEDNKEHLFHWMGLGDYNLYAQDVFVAALLHAKLKETAIVFAQAHQWKAANLNRLRSDYDSVDLKHLVVILPGHIDTLWGAFFASGDPIYVNEIISVLLQDSPAITQSSLQTIPPKAFTETQKLAEQTLKYYASLDGTVMRTIENRAAGDKELANRRYLERLLASLPHDSYVSVERNAGVAALVFLLLVAAVMLTRRKRKSMTS